MTILDKPIPFLEAVRMLARKKLLPTALTTAELRDIEAATRRQSLFSAQTLMEDLLDNYKRDVGTILNPVSTQRADRVTEANPAGNVTEGIDLGTARIRAREILTANGYSPLPDEAGTLKDLSSDARINLVVRTNVQLAQGAGKLIQGQDPAVLEAFPAQELVRFHATAKPRDWMARWQMAATSSGDMDAARAFSDFGKMAARKDSPIWDALGSSALFDDALDNPFPPFAFNSGMWVMDVPYDEAEEMGLVDLNTEVKPRPLEELFAE